jgi:hypothetical protein
MAAAKRTTGNRQAWTPAAAHAFSSWRPGAVTRLGNLDVTTSEGRQMMGIAILSALSIAGLHSAICPSYFTMKTFASQPEAKDRAMEGLWISLGVSSLASAGLYFVFERWLPAIVSEATALLLFGIGAYAINSKPPETIPPIEKQQQQKPATPPAVATAP